MAEAHTADCRCCEEAGPLTPVTVETVPALSALVYEDRAHGWFKVAVEAALTRSAPAAPASRESGELSLIDAWERILDILTFYQERVANEGFLRTTTDRSSVRELARLIAHEFQPGVGASAEVAFQLGTEKWTSDSMTLPSGMYVESIPEPGEAPRTFVTVDEIEGRGAWNALQPRRSRRNREPMERNGVVLGVRIKLMPQRVLLVTGADAVTGEQAAEVAILEMTSETEGLTRLIFAESLHHAYVRESVLIYGNVARATHGETVVEVLGSGDASIPFQSFRLNRPPLTYVSSPLGSGPESTIEVWVNGVRWEEVPTLVGRGPRDRVYVTNIADDGTAALMFGDGITGAGLPSGTQNVVARYRTGGGRRGKMDAGRLSNLLTRPLGVESVTNPIASAGGADPEMLDQARQNAPHTVRTFDRVVSLRDYEDFARSFAGIEKAQATLVWDGDMRLLHVTVAAADGGTLAEGSTLMAHLRQAIREAGDPQQPVIVQSYGPLRFGVAARVFVDPAYLAEDVLSTAAASLVEAYSFSQRSLGEAVEASGVLAVLQGVEGVAAVQLDALHEVGALRMRNTRLVARSATSVSGQVLPTELLMIDPETVQLT